MSLKVTRKKGGAGHRVDKLPPTKAFEKIVGRVPRQRGGGGNDGGDEFARIVNAELDLVAIDTDDIAMTHAEHGSKYRGVTATFCKLHWDKYKMDPPSMPMFKMLVQESGCNRGENLFTMDLADVARKLDESENEEESMGISVMPPAGFVFHESRVGSTLVANALTAMDPDGHRVYSESDPINRALAACGDGFTKCDMETNVELLRDVVFLMGRTSSPSEKRMFFKVSSVGSKRIDVMRQAFQYVPWLFVFRDPVQTMMSHIDPMKKKTVRGGLPPAVCLRSRHRPADDLRRLVFLNNPGKQAEQLSDEEFCAAHLVRLHSIWMGHLFSFAIHSYFTDSRTHARPCFLLHTSQATLCESALQQMKLSSQGAAVEYEGLVDKLVGEVFPNHFAIDVDDAARQRILDVAKIYSKSNGHDLDWEEDSKKKVSSSSREIQLAGETYMTKSYVELKKHCKYNRDWHYVYT